MPQLLTAARIELHHVPDGPRLPLVRHAALFIAVSELAPADQITLANPADHERNLNCNQ